MVDIMVEIIFLLHWIKNQRIVSNLIHDHNSIIQRTNTRTPGDVLGRRHALFFNNDVIFPPRSVSFNLNHQKPRDQTANRVTDLQTRARRQFPSQAPQ